MWEIIRKFKAVLNVGYCPGAGCASAAVTTRYEAPLTMRLSTSHTRRCTTGSRALNLWRCWCRSMSGFARKCWSLVCSNREMVRSCQYGGGAEIAVENCVMVALVQKRGRRQVCEHVDEAVVGSVRYWSARGQWNGRHYGAGLGAGHEDALLIASGQVPGHHERHQGDVERVAKTRRVSGRQDCEPGA